MGGGGWAGLVGGMGAEGGRKLKCASLFSLRDSLQAFVF